MTFEQNNGKCGKSNSNNEVNKNLFIANSY